MDAKTMDAGPINANPINAKLTLKLDRQVIEDTKRYARQHGTSLSRLVEGYFSKLTRGFREEPELSGTVAELAGIAKGVEIDDTDDGYAAYLARKYS